MQPAGAGRAEELSGQAGFTLFELVLVITIVGVLIGVMFNRLLFYQEATEKTVMEQTASIISSALNIQMAALIARDRIEDIPKLAQRNPMDWLAKKPKNYYGEYYDPKPGEIPPGNWYFDLKDHNLVYLVERGTYFIPGPDGRKWIRHKVSLVYNEPRPGEERGEKEIGGVSLDVVGSYSWLKG